MKKIFRKKVNFFDLLVVQCSINLKGIMNLFEYCNTFEDEFADLVILAEEEGDSARLKLIEELNNTFITPIERNDIFDLSRQLDEIMDYIKTTVDQIKLFKVKPDKAIKEMVGIMVEICQHVHKAVVNIEKNKEIATAEAVAVKRLENVMGARYYKAMSDIFEQEDIRIVFKFKELYKHINKTSDLSDIAMDYVLNILNTF